MQINLNDQVAVVTGGSRGIGAATVKTFAEAGARVVFNYRKAAGAARQLICELGGRDGRVVAVRADVSRMADAKKLISAALGRFGRIDIVVANAGIWFAAPAPISGTRRMAASTMWWTASRATPRSGPIKSSRSACRIRSSRARGPDACWRWSRAIC